MLNTNNRYVVALFLFMSLPTAVTTLPPCHGDDQLQDPHSLTDEQVWNLLPPAISGQGCRLPSWARTLAQAAPKSAATLLELDYAHRVSSPIPPDLRAAMRWVIADSNGCKYAMTAAMLDMSAHGVMPKKQAAIRDDHSDLWNKRERHALSFARQMSLASNSISDDEFAKLVKLFNEQTAASMVLLCAYGNMQDRLLLCLGADVEEDTKSETLAPVNVTFDPKAFVTPQKHPTVTESLELSAPAIDMVQDDKNWLALTYEELQQRLKTQRAKQTRLTVPNWEAVQRNVPSDLFQRPSDIVWYRIVFGYAPKLALPFERFMRTSGAETSDRYPRIFATSLFWVVTRAMECAYCMGHCEMNWEVAGLNQDQIAVRCRALSSDDWSAFAPAQQHAFAFARKLSQHPSQCSPADISELANDFGLETAILIAMHVSRYHYMTRISNGFQLQLESENVFFDYWNKSRDANGSQAPTDSESSSSLPTPPFDMPTSEQSWEKLPSLEFGNKTQLPHWAIAVATQLPRTAAAMLELDAIHRLRSPVAPALRAQLRWVIAKENRCLYAQAVAMADLRDITGVEVAASIEKSLLENTYTEDRDAIDFVIQLTKSASTLPDDLFQRVRLKYGDRATAAMVLLAAYGNFQDRILLGLNLPLESTGPLAPLDVRFVAGALQRSPILPENQGTAIYLDSGKPVVQPDLSWRQMTYLQLQERLEAQRHCTPRLPIPSWEQVKGNLPPEMAIKPTKIKWSLINYGYAPDLAIAWTTATRTHWAENPADRILEETLFWIQTRTIECNYCMGHCEMLLEAAGLDQTAIEKRTSLLADTDWSAFPEKEQRAYAYARKLSNAPWTLTQDDYKSLQQDFGDQQAMSIFWWLCRGLYMTRISDGFRLPLERENVFK